MKLHYEVRPATEDGRYAVVRVRQQGEELPEVCMTRYGPPLYALDREAAERLARRLDQAVR